MGRGQKGQKVAILGCQGFGICEGLDSCTVLRSNFSESDRWSVEKEFFVFVYSSPPPRGEGLKLEEEQNFSMREDGNKLQK